MASLKKSFFLQARLMQKLGDGAKPFTLSFPKSAPNSVLIKGEDGDSSQMGVSYEVRIHVGNTSEDYTGLKKSSVHMSIRKVGIYFCMYTSDNILSIGGFFLL